MFDITTTYNNAHIRTFCKRWSFIWRYFFSVSVLKFIICISLKGLQIIWKWFFYGKTLKTCFNFQRVWKDTGSMSVTISIFTIFHCLFHLPSRQRMAIWLSQGRSNLESWGRVQGTYLGRWFETPWGCSQDVPWGTPKNVLGTMWGHHVDISNFFFIFLSELVRLTKSI